MFRIHTKNNRLRINIRLSQIFHYSFRHCLCAIVNYQITIKILEVVQAIVNKITQLIAFTKLRTIPLQIHIQTNPHHLVRSQKTIINPLLQRISIDRITKIFNIRNLLRFLRCSRQTHMGRRTEIFQNFAPFAIFRRTTPMTFINHDQIKKVGTKLTISIKNIIFIID